MVRRSTQSLSIQPTRNCSQTRESQVTPTPVSCSSLLLSGCNDAHFPGEPVTPAESTAFSRIVSEMVSYCCFFQKTAGTFARTFLFVRGAVKTLKGESGYKTAACVDSQPHVSGHPAESSAFPQTCPKTTRGYSIESIYPQGNICLINRIPFQLHKTLLKEGKQRQRK